MRPWNSMNGWVSKALPVENAEQHGWCTAFTRFSG
jgi:hypothetical protein